jgi:hypothetical protein
MCSRIIWFWEPFIASSERLVKPRATPLLEPLQSAL